MNKELWTYQKRNENEMRLLSTYFCHYVFQQPSLCRAIYVCLSTYSLLNSPLHSRLHFLGIIIIVVVVVVASAYLQLITNHTSFACVTHSLINTYTNAAAFIVIERFDKVEKGRKTNEYLDQHVDSKTSDGVFAITI